MLGIPTVVCGPGSMDQGHKPDEFIHIDQINQCDAFMARLITQLSG
ncbi:M20/M25/M40 family metallo-hydrolase [Aliamphritea spongicola]|nr:M20/M25/M40 family metallo-hydrolase [Aliamphritea spongicola]